MILLSQRCGMFGILTTILCCCTSLGQVNQEKLSTVVQQAHAALKSGDRDSAARLSSELLKACDVDAQRTHADPLRNRFLISAAQIDFDAGQPERAERTLAVVARDAGKESPERLTAMAYLVRISILRGQFDRRLAVETLGESSLLGDENRTLRADIQSFVIDAVAFAPLATAITKGSTKDDFRKFVELIRQTQRELADAGVPPGVTRLTNLAVAEFCSRTGMDGQLENELIQLRPVIQSDLIAHQWSAKYWNLVATLRLKRRQFAEACDAANEFRIEAQKSGRVDLPIIAQEMLALIALQLGDYHEARSMLEANRGFHLQSKDLRNTTDWQINLAKAMEGDRDFLIARIELREAQTALRKHAESSADHTLDLRTANVANNLGLNHYLTGELDQAQKLIESAKEIYVRSLDASDLTLGECDINLGWVALSRNDLAQAAARFAKAADHFKAFYSQDHPRYIEALGCQARASVLRGEVEAARLRIVEAEHLAYKSICKTLGGMPSARDRLALIQETRVHPESVAWPGTLDTYLELANRLSISPRDQYAVLLRWKGLANRYQRMFHRAESRTDIEREQALMNQLRAVYFRRASPLKRRAQMSEIAVLEGQLRNLQRSMVEHGSVNIEREPVVADIARQLATGEILIDIIQTRCFVSPTVGGRIGSSATYEAFVIDHQGGVQRVSLGEADAIDAAIVLWRKAIVDQSADLETTARKVASLIQQPLLVGGLKWESIRVRADAMLHLLPWAALPGVDGKRYWIENVSIELVNDVQVSETPALLAASGNLLIAGGIEYGALKSVWPTLPGSMTESNMVADLFRKSFPSQDVLELTERAASESAVLRATSGKRFLHFATHGFFRKAGDADAFALLGASALLSTGLIVAEPSADETQRDQYLTAAEIRESDLSGCELVMLSACESGLGQVSAGQGIAGMMDAFHSAGAVNVVGTLWQVGDQAMVEFVQRFYQYLWRDNLTVTQAIRAAQLDLIAYSDAELLSHPNAWSALVVSKNLNSAGIAGNQPKSK